VAGRKGRSDFPRTGFGGRLRALREAAGLAQERLAQRAGCSVGTLSKLERGSQEPYWPLVLMLAKALGARPNDFVPQGDAAPHSAAGQAGAEQQTPPSGEQGKGKRKGRGA
jgi:transcriptional regulator with XRE-family HTH domain